MKAKKPFHMSRRPLVPLVETEESRNLRDALGVPRLFSSPRLIGVARDPWTVFAYWDADWPSIFKNTAPIDRQIHLRIHCADGLEEKEAAAEPMAGMCCVAMSQQHRECRLEMGYYRPADVWHSVATSNAVAIPSSGTARIEDVDVATIPFHLTFQQLVELYGAKEEALAAAISRAQTRAVSRARNGKSSRDERKIARVTGIALSEIAAARQAFNRVDVRKLQKQEQTLFQSGATSPSHGFRANRTAPGS